MPTLGLSLVGFMQDQQHAISHLRNACVPNPSNKTDQQLIADWSAAKVQLGPPVANAGNPHIQAIPDNNPNLQQLLAGPLGSIVQQFVQEQGASFQMVEIDPLLAFQFTVDKSRSQTHCGSLSSPPSHGELMDACLPVNPQTDPVHFSQKQQSIIFKSRSLNLRLIAEGVMPNPPNVVGIQFGWGLPLVHVVRYNGLCYLHNGYHRAFGVKMAGANEMPCIFRDVGDAEAAGIKGDGNTFEEPLLTSPNPPTMAHFTQGRAYDVDLRATSRILQINWSDHVMAEE